MTEFLKTVANHYKQLSVEEASKTGEPASLPLSRYVFCFPNHRSSLFFSRYLHEAFGGPCCVPATITINDLFGLFSNRCLADRTTLLFKLYQNYRILSQRSDKEEFDQFVFWGDMLLADFDDVDKYLVPADRLFSNIRDLKEIEAAFAGFEPEVIEVIQSFWRNYKPATTAEDSKREAFSQTWSILNDLYILFKRCLAEENLAYTGMIEREVVENKGLSFDKLPYHKVIFVGLTAISKAERMLMSRLLLEGRAEFCWDYADPLLKDRKSPMSSATFFTSQNLHDFPNALSDQELGEGLVPDQERKYSLYAVPSGVGQAQLARRILQSWLQNLPKFDPFRTAVVLPDEHLLLPMLYAVPAEFKKFNVTMGYGLNDTAVAAFVQNLANLQEACRHYDDRPDTFYYKQVQTLLQHNFTSAIVGEEAHTLSLKINENNLYQVPATVFGVHPFLQMIFRYINSADETIDYLLQILEHIMANDKLFSDTDYEFVYHYRATVEKLGKSVHEQNFSFTPRTLFMLLGKLINGVSVPFQGEPLQGLQVMGVLETRALDFDNVIILSMNEGIFPAKPSNNTFVPMSLRSAFDMPTQKHRDAVFAYHFYRLISRAQHVALIYDSRTEGMQTGEESRYIKQLRFLLGHTLKPRVISSNISTSTRNVIEVKKTPEMLLRLKQYIGPEGKGALSASSLKDFIKCPLRFYLGFVKGLREDEDVNEGVDQRTFGDILHNAMRQLYSKCEGKRVDSGLLKQYIENPDGEVTRAILKGFEEEMKVTQVEGYNLLVSRILVKYAVEILRHDLKLGPFEYLAGELKKKFLYKINDDLTVRITCVFDRIDRPLKEDGVIRIVDYKTGNSGLGARKLIFPDVASLFTSEEKGSSEAFQVFLYCLILASASNEQLKDFHIDRTVANHYVPHLYFVRDFKSSVNVDTRLLDNSGKSKIPVDDFAPYADEFRDQFRHLIERIFDPEESFSQCEDEHHCTFCAFASYCMKNKLTNI